MFKSKLSKVIVSLLRRIAGVTRSGAKRLMRAMLQAMMAMGRRARLPVAGFVLPTVTMVLLVVILLTVAITLRSFDRANTARNVRVNQQVLAAATPALDRAKAKIEFMLREDPQRPTATPSDAELYRIMSSYDINNDFYTFGDEKRLILRASLTGAANLTNPNDDPKLGLLIGTPARENEALNTAWRYPVDTNNDGIFDTFTLYGIYFRTPKTQRPRRELDARTPPMDAGILNPDCTQGEGTVASLVGDSGWERKSGRIQKSFFVYTVNVPITPQDIADNGLDNTYQAFQGTTSVSALEYQQDQSRIPLSNNAVVYEDDLDISPGPPLSLNGRILTNSNLLVSSLGGNRRIRLFQVSSQQSCFYDRENSKIVVAGNVVNGWSGSTVAPPANNPVEVHLFTKSGETPPTIGNLPSPAIDPNNQSVTQNSLGVLYNNDAYSARLDALVAAVTDPANYPVEVIQATQPPKSQTPEQALEDYFKARLRKVPFAEVPPGTANRGVDPADAPYIIQDNGVNSLRPIDKWSLPTTTTVIGSEVKGTLSGAGRAEITIPPDQLPSRNPALPLPGESEENLGERVAVGNNLPEKRWDASKNQFVSDEQAVIGATWTDGGERTRTPQVTKLADAGATDRGNGTGEAPSNIIPPYRDGFWEKAAAEIPKNFLDSVGGLRVITGAGVYDRTNSFLPPPRWIETVNPAAPTLKSGPALITANPPANNTYDDPATGANEQYPVVWPDSMPMSPLGPGSQVYDNVAGNWIPWPGVPTPQDIGLPPAVASPVGETPATAFKFAKGDLRMRATAVYHYANNGYDPIALAAAQVAAPGTQPQQTPVACISSYYDPSNAFTARNIVGLNDVSGEVIPRSPVTRGAQQAFIGSNNGIVYGPPTVRLNPGTSRPNAFGLLTGGEPILEAQANLVFPDGRFANGPLRTALQVPDGQRTLAQKAAIDSTNCALQILDGTIARGGQLIPIPDGAIQEVAFLNSREVKAIDRDNTATTVNEAFTLSSPFPVPLPRNPQAATLTGNYDQPLEERQPLEIRATQLDINALRGAPVAGPRATPPEWLLPNSGIIYASRDDALPDRSARSADAENSKRLSPTDYRLDPTRKPNGIVLINGDQLFRGGNPTGENSVNKVVREKGLTLVSNLPAYIKGRFNLHGTIQPPAPGAPPNNNIVPVEEFRELVAPPAPPADPGWGNFYARTSQNNGLNPNFACRALDPRLPNCDRGDFWRPATVLVDSLTLLSSNYRFGFRNEGDFDLRNNAGAAALWPRRQQGFFNNNFVTNGLSSGAFSTNGILVGTPGAVGAALTDATYTAAFPANGLFTSSYFNNFVTPVQRRGFFPEYVMETCTKLPVAACTDNDWFVNPLAAIPLRASAPTLPATYTSPPTDPAQAAAATFQAGSTVDPPVAALQRFPRRVAFSRNPDPANPTNFTLLNTAPLQPLGIGPTPGRAIAGGAGAPRANSLWFAGGGVGNVNFNATTAPYVVNNPTVTTATVTPPDTTDGANVAVPRLGPTSLPANSAIGPTPSPAAPIPLTPPLPFNGSQPLLLPVPQIQIGSAATAPGGTTMPRGTAAGNARNTAWISQAVDTPFNVIVGAGDTPSRTLDSGFTSGDFNGGLQNLPRFLESWDNGRFATNIRGSFIQQRRSAFSTAPYQPILPQPYQQSVPAASLASLFQLQRQPAGTPLASLAITNTYNTDTGAGFIPYFSPPLRNWGFDVGLLSQPPDLFTQRFTTPSTKTQPAEYFREVSRNDEWVKTLMCGVVAPDQNPGAGKNATASRPSNCPT
ncbi:hormogonium polysaccharide biosynthesis protein HpsA [Microcoleus sp. F6_B4]